MTLAELQTLTYNRVRLQRKMYYVVNESTSFSVAWENATEKEKEIIANLVSDNNIDGVYKQIREICNSELEQKNVQELRKIALKYGFSGLSRHTKSELLSLIYGAQENEKIGSH